MSMITLAYDFKGTDMATSGSKQSNRPEYPDVLAPLRNALNQRKKRKAVTIALAIIFISSLAFSFKLCTSRSITPAPLASLELASAPFPVTNRQAAEIPLAKNVVLGKEEEKVLAIVSGGAVKQSPEFNVKKKTGNKQSVVKESVRTIKKKELTRESASAKEKKVEVVSAEKGIKTARQVINKKPYNSKQKTQPLTKISASVNRDEIKSESSVIPTIEIAENKAEEKVPGHVLRNNTPESQVKSESESTDQEEVVLEVISGSTVIEIPAEQFLDERTGKADSEQAVPEETEITEQKFPAIPIENTEAQSASSQESMEQRDSYAPAKPDTEPLPAKETEQVVRKIPAEKPAETTGQAMTNATVDNSGKKTETTNQSVSGPMPKIQGNVKKPPVSVAGDKPKTTESKNSVIRLTSGPVAPQFIKLDQAGEELVVTEAEWVCVKDASNGLVWERKTDNGGLQDMNHSFSWYQTRADSDNPVTVKSGVADGGRCKGGIACDTQAYVREMNARKLCGYSDWRLPTKEELLTLVTFQNNSTVASIDSHFFPHAVPSWYWTASANNEHEEYAWYVLFRNGVPLNDLKKRPKHIRLVRTDKKKPKHTGELAQQ